MVSQVPESILYHTRTLSIIGNIVRLALTKSTGDSPSFGDLAEVRDEQGGLRIAQVVKLDDEVASLQVFSGTQGVTTRAKIRFLGHPPDVAFSSNILGRAFGGDGTPLDGGPPLDMDPRIAIGGPSVNPVRRKPATNMIRTNVPMIDVFNCLVESQKIPIFSVSGEPADSTARWAQAMRETSGRLEEIPGEEGFPAYLDSSIKGVYKRAGVVRTNDGKVGALTMIGTVSPAGGNFEEPVTQSTLSAVKCFLGLSAERAYKRFYPAVDPLLSWSRYREQLAPWFRNKVGPDWSEQVDQMMELLRRGDEIMQMMQVTGEDGVTLADFVTQRASLFLDMVFLQQDAFDDVDGACKPERQKALFDMVYAAATRAYAFKDKAAARDFFTRLTGLYKNLNYAAAGSNDFRRITKSIGELDRSIPTVAAKTAAPNGGATKGG